MIKYFYIFIFFIFIGCSSTTKNMNISELEKNTTTKVYEDISKDAIFEAAKKVFILLGEDQFRIDSYRNNLEVQKTKLNHFPFYAYTTNDIWNVSIEEKDDKSIVKINIKRVKDFDEEDSEYLSKDSHNLLLERIDYLLGLNDSWNSCFLSINDVLCDKIDLSIVNSPTQDDLIKNIFISQREASKSLSEIEDDILADDVVFTLEDSNDDILEKQNDTLEDTQENIDTENELDKRIQELDDIVNDNIDKTLDRITTENE
ncbi:hypothetical protein ACMC56_07195 [Campylobacterota bacterium DY0563]